MTNLVLAALVEQVKNSVVFHLLLNYVFENLNVVTLLFVSNRLFAQGLFKLFNCLHIEMTLRNFS